VNNRINTVEGLTIIPTGAALGAEIRGLDLSLPLPDETVTAVRGALLDHCVVFFRGQELSDEDQVRFTNYFGKAEVHVRDMPDRPVKEILFISNIKKDGKDIGALGDREVGFHSDLAYMPKPGTLSALYAVEIPDSGGETRWGSGYAAYEALEDGMKERLKGLRATHRHPDTPLNPPEIIDHPVVCTHPETGRKSLYVTPMFTRSIVGLEDHESRALVDTLANHVTRPEFIWTHEWRVGDLVMWDNRPTMHGRGRFPSDQRRLMKRTQVFNDVAPVA
tara:strand:+ start:474 stop:1304 length:831 start_codon:yes stop_codon:yes gene_type:complete